MWNIIAMFYQAEWILRIVLYRVVSFSNCHSSTSLWCPCCFIIPRTDLESECVECVGKKGWSLWFWIYSDRGRSSSKLQRRRNTTQRANRKWKLLNLTSVDRNSRNFQLNCKKYRTRRKIFQTQYLPWQMGILTGLLYRRSGGSISDWYVFFFSDEWDLKSIWLVGCLCNLMQSIMELVMEIRSWYF